MEVPAKPNNDYPYHQFIKSPAQLGASKQGTISALGKDLGALFYYVDTLVTGHPKDGFPLGNKYFLTTGATCNDKNGESHVRSIYINNIPDGNIPFVSSNSGISLSEFKGLVPGVLGNITYINPLKIFSAFGGSSTCQKITMQTKDIANNISQDSQYVLDSDIKDYNPCWFPDRRNPVTNVSCREGMTNGPSHYPDDLLLHTYVFGIGLLGVYLLYGIMKRD